MNLKMKKLFIIVNVVWKDLMNVKCLANCEKNRNFTKLNAKL